jgi:hypothetical protein
MLFLFRHRKAVLPHIASKASIPSFALPIAKKEKFDIRKVICACHYAVAAFASCIPALAGRMTVTEQA